MRINLGGIIDECHNVALFGFGLVEHHGIGVQEWRLRQDLYFDDIIEISICRNGDFSTVNHVPVLVGVDSPKDTGHIGLDIFLSYLTRIFVL